MKNSCSIHDNSCLTKKDKTMKKIYQSPETLLMTIATQQMIAASELIKDNQQDLNEAPTTNETSGNLSRRSVWDDEEEEEEW